jgi:transcriptional regulator with XRE-family HTH domain
MAYRSQITAELRAEMAAQRYTIKGLAELTGYSRSLLNSRFNGHKAFDMDELAAITKVLGITVKELLARAETRAAA